MDSAQRQLEALLVVRAQTGDQAAFEEIVRRYHARLLYFVRRMVSDYSSADDVLQDVWLAVHRQLPQLRSPETLRVWLYRIARNRAFQTMRQPRHHDEPELMDCIAAPDADEPQFTAADADRLHAALNRLSPAHRETLTLRFLEQLSYEELAETTDCDLGTVKSRLYYAKRAIKNELEKMP